MNVRHVLTNRFISCWQNTTRFSADNEGKIMAQAANFKTVQLALRVNDMSLCWIDNDMDKNSSGATKPMITYLGVWKPIWQVFVFQRGVVLWCGADKQTYRVNRCLIRLHPGWPWVGGALRHALSVARRPTRRRRPNYTFSIIQDGDALDMAIVNSARGF